MPIPAPQFDQPSSDDEQSDDPVADDPLGGRGPALRVANTRPFICVKNDKYGSIIICNNLFFRLQVI